MIKAAARPVPKERTVGRIFHHLGFAGLRGVGPDALAIDVDHEGVETEVAKHLGAFMGVLANAHPFRKYENARPLGAGIVPDRKPLTFVAVVLVFDDARLEHYRLPGLPIQ